MSYVINGSKLYSNTNTENKKNLFTHMSQFITHELNLNKNIFEHILHNNLDNLIGIIL